MTSAREGIEEILTRYAWGLSTGDRDLLDSCFHDEADVTFPSGYRAQGRAAVLEELHRLQDRFEPGGWILIASTLILSETDTEVRANSFYITVGSESGQIVIKSTGWYEDVFVVEEGTWRIGRRVVQSRLRRIASPNPLEAR
jgi:hypothetical protein